MASPARPAPRRSELRGLLREGQQPPLPQLLERLDVTALCPRLAWQEAGERRSEHCGYGMPHASHSPKDRLLSWFCAVPEQRAKAHQLHAHCGRRSRERRGQLRRCFFEHVTSDQELQRIAVQLDGGAR